MLCILQYSTLCLTSSSRSVNGCYAMSDRSGSTWARTRDGQINSMVTVVGQNMHPPIHITPNPMPNPQSAICLSCRRNKQTGHPRIKPRHTPASIPLRRLRKPQEWNLRTARIPAGEKRDRPVRFTQISPNGNLAQLVEQRTLKTANTVSIGLQVEDL